MAPTSARFDCRFAALQLESRPTDYGQRWPFRKAPQAGFQTVRLASDTTAILPFICKRRNKGHDDRGLDPGGATRTCQALQ